MEAGDAVALTSFCGMQYTSTENTYIRFCECQLVRASKLGNHRGYRKGAREGKPEVGAAGVRVCAGGRRSS